MSTRVLLTNDDGLHAPGLQTLRRALAELPDLDVRVVAPDGNRSATGRGITILRPLRVQEVVLDDGTTAWQCDGMPADCVRLAGQGLVPGWRPDLVVAGINHGANLGEDVTYSGTVAAALESVVHGVPGVAISAASPAGEWVVDEDAWDFAHAAAIGARIVAGLARTPVSDRTILNVNVPFGLPAAVEVTRLGRRIYDDELREVGEADADGWRSYTVYGTLHGHAHEDGTDLVAVARGNVSITPLHLDLTHRTSIEALTGHGFASLLERLDTGSAA